MADARAAGNDDPTIFVYIPKESAEDLKKAIIEYEAAKATIEFKGTPTTDEGRDARDAMSTRMKAAEAARDSIIRDVINAARVFQGGGKSVLSSPSKKSAGSRRSILGPPLSELPGSRRRPLADCSR